MNPLREPLVHFLAIGGLLFGVFAIADYRKAHQLDQRIEITADLVRKQLVEFQQTHGHAPTSGERQAVIDDCVRAEVLVREARHQGLDEDDAVVRHRLRERMEEKIRAGSDVSSSYEKIRARYEIVIEPAATSVSATP